MPNRRKLALGPLPDQEVDYSRFERTEILWGRILLLFGLVFAAAFSVIYLLFQPLSNAPTVVSVIEQRRTADELIATDRTPQEGAVVAAMEVVAEPESDKLALVASEMKEKLVAPPQLEREPEGKLEAKPISPVTTLHPSIRAAVLASDIDSKKRPTDTLGYEVSMQGQDLIKVVLHMDMNGLSGTTLFHEWHLGDKRQARVRIPINNALQSSYSSKFIDKYMTGEWSVQVKDEKGEVYAMANFVVER